MAKSGHRAGSAPSAKNRPASSPRSQPSAGSAKRRGNARAYPAASRYTRGYSGLPRPPPSCASARAPTAESAQDSTVHRAGARAPLSLRFTWRAAAHTPAATKSAQGAIRAGPSSPECANAPRMSRTARPKTATGMAALPAQRRARLVQCSAMPSLELDQHLIRTDETELLPRFLLQDPAIHGSRERPDPPLQAGVLLAERLVRSLLPGDVLVEFSQEAHAVGVGQRGHRDDQRGDRCSRYPAARRADEGREVHRRGAFHARSYPARKPPTPHSPTRRYPAYERFALRVKRLETRSRLG